MAQSICIQLFSITLFLASQSLGSSELVPAAGQQARYHTACCQRLPYLYLAKGLKHTLDVRL